ncbi:hypothetical protein [Halarchaeum sp. P4]|uniref:hypothetical protein n=1 Tax=Halarchaeum sp. P4 TaxID=3421639 RepID=UPI003EC0E985
MTDYDRREFVGALGIGALGALGAEKYLSGNGRAGAADANGTADPDNASIGNETDGDGTQDLPEGTSEWTEADVPVEASLNDVVTAKDGLYAVGESGVVLHRESDGTWSTVVENGPYAAQNELAGAAVTDNGGHVWFAGGSGALGVYKIPTGQVTDYSFPKEHTSSWSDVAVVGLAGSEWVFLVNSSGELFRGRMDAGSMTWADEVVEPGSGTTIPAICTDSNGFGYVADSSGAVYESVDGGKSWKKIGIKGNDGALYDIAALGTHTIDVAGDDGHLFNFNGFRWDRRDIGQKTLYAVSRSRRDGVVAGEGGHVWEFTEDGWTEADSPTGAQLNGTTLGSSTHPAVVVGGSSTVLERQR